MFEDAKRKGGYNTMENENMPEFELDFDKYNENNKMYWFPSSDEEKNNQIIKMLSEKKLDYFMFQNANETSATINGNYLCGYESIICFLKLQNDSGVFDTSEDVITKSKSVEKKSNQDELNL